jgi:hypothetical protein
MEWRALRGSTRVRTRVTTQPTLLHAQERRPYTYDLRVKVYGFGRAHGHGGIEFWNDATRSTDPRPLIYTGLRLSLFESLYVLHNVELRPGLHTFKFKLSGCVVH